MTDSATPSRPARSATIPAITPAGTPPSSVAVPPGGAVGRVGHDVVGRGVAVPPGEVGDGDPVPSGEVDDGDAGAVLAGGAPDDGVPDGVGAPEGVHPATRTAPMRSERNGPVRPCTRPMCPPFAGCTSSVSLSL
jgi:hypothetical protein